MTEREVAVTNRAGLHARAAAKLVHLASTFAAEVKLLRDGEEVDAKSILGILLLAAAQGSTLLVRCSGPDEEAASEAVARLFAEGFGETRE